MTLPSPLRELAADIRPDDARSDVYAVSNAQLASWAAKIESLAVEYAVVPRVSSWETRKAARAAGIFDPRVAEATWNAMIEAAERQETK